MSENQEKKVVVTPEDVKAAFDFWHQFKITPMPGLEDAVNRFASDPSFENQELVKLMFCKAVATTDHECFTDETFKKVAEECSAVAYDMEFDRDFEEVVTVQQEGE